MTPENCSLLSKARWYAITFAHAGKQSDLYYSAVKRGTREWARRNGLIEDDSRYIALTDKGQDLFRSEKALRGDRWMTGTIYNSLSGQRT